MNFFKIRHIHVLMDGTIWCQCNGCEVRKSREYVCWINEFGQKMTPLFDSATNDLVGFFNAEEINIEFEEE